MIFGSPDMYKDDYSKFDQLLVNLEAFTSSDSVHILASLIFRIGLITKVQILLLRCRHPEWIDIDHL
ncbi:hypothetical protein LSH36_199g01019 [Paralvinella palmiformis]|uniref:Uncharacterized protein n=1 Tax=Paralvinella palmiformis TaxID=53620 RepID=A0AAD9N531_9ANNE|nr:hypothetical protein LSH36_199g01019 [Paralvinella palmiformis]